MAVYPRGIVATGVSTTSSTTVAATTTEYVPVGHLLVIGVAADNLSASTPTVTSVSDNSTASGSANTYTVRGQGARNATAAAGIMGAVVTCKVTRPMPVGTAITVTLSGAVAHKAMHVYGFAGVTDTLQGVVATANGSSSTPSVTLSTVNATLAANDMVFGFFAVESNVTPTAYDTDTVNGTWSTGVTTSSATGGTANTRVQVVSQWKQVTATGAQTYNITANNTDWIGWCFALQPETVTAIGGLTENFAAGTMPEEFQEVMFNSGGPASTAANELHQLSDSAIHLVRRTLTNSTWIVQVKDWAGEIIISQWDNNIGMGVYSPDGVNLYGYFNDEPEVLFTPGGTNFWVRFVHSSSGISTIDWSANGTTWTNITSRNPGPTFPFNVAPKMVVTGVNARLRTDNYNLPPPSAPLNLVATPGNTQVVLTWDPPAIGAPITDYIVQYRVKP